MEIINNKDKNEANKKAAPLAQALLIYGNEAQKQFAYTSASGENAFDGEYTLTQPAGTQAEFIGLFSEKQPAKPDAAKEAEIKSNYGLDFYGASLLLEDKTTCAMYFEKTAAKDVTVTYNGKTLAAKSEAGTNRIYYEIQGIKPQELTDNFTFTMSDGTNSTDVSFNPVYYLGAGIYRTSQTDQLRSTLLALYNYSSTAQTYTAN